MCCTRFFAAALSVVQGTLRCTCAGVLSAIGELEGQTKGLHCVGLQTLELLALRLHSLRLCVEFGFSNMLCYCRHNHIYLGTVLTNVKSKNFAGLVPIE